MILNRAGILGICLYRFVVSLFSAAYYKILRRACRHKFMAVDSFRFNSGMFYNRIIVYKCDRCGDYCYSYRWAFGSASGALDCYYPKHKDYCSSGSVFDRLTEDEHVHKAMDMLSNYFQISGNTVLGMRI